MSKPKKEDKLKRAQEFLTETFGEEAVTTFLTGVPEADRAAKLEGVADALMRQDEFNRQMNATSEELKTLREGAAKFAGVEQWRANINDWANQERTRLAEKEAELAQREAALGGEGGEGEGGEGQRKSTPPPTIPKDIVTATQLKEALDGGMSVVSQYVPALIRISNAHRKEFGDELDYDAWMKFSREQGLDPWTSGYDKFVAEKREEKRDADIAKKIAEAEKRGEAQALEKMKAAALPHLPGPTGAFGGGTLSGLAKDRQRGGLDAAVKELARLKREGGVPPSV